TKSEAHARLSGLRSRGSHTRRYRTHSPDQQKAIRCLDPVSCSHTNSTGMGGRTGCVSSTASRRSLLYFLRFAPELSVLAFVTFQLIMRFQGKAEPNRSPASSVPRRTFPAASCAP